MPDYTQLSLGQLRSELATQAAIHEGAGLERKLIAEEILKRERIARARVQGMSELDKEAFREALKK